ncbi:MAG: hypothetical protein ACI8WT_004387 [Clostridium sp.]|jgi:hypothetical protein
MGAYMNKKFLYFIIVSLLLFNVVTFSKLNSLENNINSRFQQSDSVANNLRNEIDSVYSNVDIKLKKQGSILDNYNVTLGELNQSNFTIPVTLTLTPKEYSKGLIASLNLNDKNVPMKNEGTSFVANVDAYVFDDFSLEVVLEHDGVKKIETIEEYHDLRSKYLLDISGGFNGQSTYSSKEFQYSGNIDLKIGSSKAGSTEKINIINDVNGVIVSQREIEPSDNTSIDVKENIKLDEGDKLTIYAIVQDRYGLNYKYVLDIYEVDNNKEDFNYNSEREKRRLVEITDRNGKIVYEPKNDIIK